LTVFEFVTEFYTAIFIPSMLSGVTSPASGAVMLAGDLLTNAYYIYYIYRLASQPIAANEITTVIEEALGL
jgi:hypothetical protein